MIMKSLIGKMCLKLQIKMVHSYKMYDSNLFIWYQYERLYLSDQITQVVVNTYVII